MRKLKVDGLLIIKRHFQLLIRHDGRKRICDKDFKKEVYVCESDNVFLIHYIGDETRSELRAHGNSKKPNKIFLRTQPSVLQMLKNTAVAQSGVSAHKMYKDSIERGVQEVQKKVNVSEDSANHDVNERPLNDVDIRKDINKEGSECSINDFVV